MTSHNFDYPLTVAEADDIVHRLTEGKMRVTQVGSEVLLRFRNREDGHRLTDQEMTRRGLVRKLIELLP